MKGIYLLLFLTLAQIGYAEVWPAMWIGSDKHLQSSGLRVAYFRKTANLIKVPAEYVIYVSADNRYKLYVNGTLASWGPARSDIYNWNYEIVNIAPYLHKGENTIAAIVWNYGEMRPVAQMGTDEISFLLRVKQGDPVFNTDESWQVLTDNAYSTFDEFTVPGYFAAGCGERFDARHYPWGWEQGEKNECSEWESAYPMDYAFDKGERDRWGRSLVPRSIPQMEMKKTSAGDIELPITIKPYTRKTILIDRDSLTTAYLHLTISGGKGARLEVCYAEALFNSNMPDIWHASKPHRDIVEGKLMLGNKDLFLIDGGLHRQMTTLWWRTWRYLQLTIETFDDSLTIEHIGATFTAYPFVKESHLQGNDELRQMEEIGWLTARLCANETYMDCPYYEQLQYFGDTRIQAMITMYNTRDSLMPRHAIEQGRMSMTADGITQSRYPSSLPQMISSYSLSWIGMLYDYWMMRDDRDWLRQYLPAARSILGWYEGYLREDMSLNRIPHWFFADWADTFTYGEPNYGKEGTSAYQDLVLILALREQAAMESAFGITALGNHYSNLAQRMAETIKPKYWNAQRSLLSDTPEQNTYSQHVNVLAILADIFTPEEARTVYSTAIADTTLAKGTFYFRYFIHLAMDKVGLADNWLDTLQPWREQIAIGLTTWAETPEPSRSDCHAWSAHLNIEFYRMLLGIHSVAPGFSKIRLTPALGDLQEVAGSIPHPAGIIAVTYKKRNNSLYANIALPQGITATLEWKGQHIEINGSQTVIITE